MKRRAAPVLAGWILLASKAMAHDPAAVQEAAPYGYPVGDGRDYAHGLLDEFEGRFDGGGGFRWEGEAWFGDDTNRLWVKSEGSAEARRLEDGQQEIFYDRPITPYFDVQAGARYDLDSRPGRGWAALGVEGLAPYFVKLSATAYAGDRGRLAVKLKGSDEIRFTQRLILEPEVELDVYAEDDRRRGMGRGLSDLDAGLRLRWEISRKFAPYVGAAYEDRFGPSPASSGARSIPADGLKLAVGLRAWF